MKLHVASHKHGWATAAGCDGTWLELCRLIHSRFGLAHTTKSTAFVRYVRVVSGESRNQYTSSFCESSSDCQWHTATEIGTHKLRALRVSVST